MKRIFLYLLVFVTFLSGTIFAKDLTSQLLKGIEYINAGDYEQALSEFKYIVHTGTTSPNLHLCIGICYINLGKFEKAVNEFEQEIKLNPAIAEPYYFLAMLSEYHNEKQKAINYWQKFTRLTENKELKEIAAKHVEALREK